MSGRAPVVRTCFVIFLVSLSAAALHQPLPGIRWEDRSLAMRAEFEASMEVFLPKSTFVDILFFTVYPLLPLPTELQDFTS